MGNEQRHRTECIKRGFATPLSATVIEVGDALWHDGTSVYPAGSIAYLGGAPSTFDFCQRKFAAHSLGVALDASPAGKTAPVQFAYDGEWEFPCAALSGALKQGALFGPDDDGASLDALYDQQLEQVLDPRRASFVMTRDAANGATAVWVRPLSGTERANLNASVQMIKFPAVVLQTDNDPAVTDYTFGKRVRILEIGAICTVLVDSDTQNAIIEMRNAANILDDTLTIPDETARGEVVTQAVDDAADYDVFGAEDVFDISVTTEATSAGSVAGEVEPYVIIADLSHTK